MEMAREGAQSVRGGMSEIADSTTRLGVYPEREDNEGIRNDTSVECDASSLVGWAQWANIVRWKSVEC